MLSTFRFRLGNMPCTKLIGSVFTARAYARAVLGVVILSVFPSVRLSVCPSVCLSVTSVDCDKTKWCTADILISHERAITLLLWHQQWRRPSHWNPRSKWPTPFEKRRLRQISAYNISTVRDSEKSSIMTNIKSTTGFPRSYRWSAYVTQSPQRVAQRAIFSVFWAKVNGWSSQELST